MLELLTLLVLLFCVIAASGLFIRRKIQQRHRAFYRVRGNQGVDEMTSLTINGCLQWLHLRGRSKDNPVLLFLHGGPGLPHIGWYDEMQRPWEDYFTVVQWDQRQVGKSYASLKAMGSSLNHEQMVADGIEVIRYLRKHLNKQKIVLMGWSYGSCLGATIAQKKPGWVSAYIGVSQSVDVFKSVQAEHQFLIEYAKSQNNQDLLNQLLHMTPRPDPENKMSSFLQHGGFITNELYKAGKFDFSPVDYATITQYDFLTSPYYTLKDLFNRRFGDPSAALVNGHPFGEEFMLIDLPRQIGSCFEVPIFFFTSRNDWHVSYQLTDQWFQEIEAPYKQQIWFEQSSHLPTYTSPGEFLVALVTQVLPYAQHD